MDDPDDIRVADPAELRARAHVERGDLAAAATELVTAFGPEVLGWLHTIAASPGDAEDAFSHLCERLWLALPTFEWTGSIRTWMYVVGRNLVRDDARRRYKRPQSPISGAHELAAVVRSSTAAYRKTEPKARLSALREELQPDDRMLLTLRVDKELPWRDIAQILTGGEADPAALSREAARARKQFGRLKDRLRKAWSGD